MNESSDPIPTINLVARAQGGEEQAREELFQRYSDRVLDIVRLRLGRGLRRSLDSTDVLQESLAEALRGLDRFDMRDESSLIRWLSKIVEHRIAARAEYHGAQKRSAASELSMDRIPAQNQSGDLHSLLSDHGASPATRAGNDEEQELVLQCLEELPAKHRDLIIARDYTGSSWEDVAAQAGLSSPNAARMMHSRALGRLGKMLRERGLS